MNLKETITCVWVCRRVHEYCRRDVVIAKHG